MLAAVNPWRFEPHPDTWLVVVLAAFGYWYAVTRIGPRARAGVRSGPAAGAGAGVEAGAGRAGVEVARVEAGAGAGRAGVEAAAVTRPAVTRAAVTRAVTRRQVVCFSAGLLAIEVASDWPIHDLAENYLFSAHMVQHMLISLIAPPLLLLGTPVWLIRRILRARWAAGTVRVMGRPLVAGLTFNSVVAISHAPFWVNGTLEHHFLHFWAHLLLFVTALFMWFPVVNKLEDFPTISGPGRMIYLFAQSIIPNVPAAFLAMSDGVVYKFYAAVPHPIAGFSAINDQQLAGAIMKVGGTFYLWGIITVLFFRWAAAQYRSGTAAEDRAASALAGEADLVRRRQPLLQAAPAAAGRSAAPGTPGSRGPSPMPKVLTWDHVAEELARTPPAEPAG